MIYTHSLKFIALLVGFLNAQLIWAASPQRPNIVLVMTDDQGYGDLGCHGNDQIQTPYLDQLYRQSVRLTNYHVDPTCSPTRAALMTGRYSSRTGVWHTIMGRSLMHPDETTLAEILRDAGYQTGLFGKWHLGDNFPLRPQDQGFQTVAMHGGGGVGQTPDWFGNDYFDDTYWLNGHPRSTSGYCTDVWFDNALEFIEQNRKKPFFLYLPTNAAHGPYLVAKKYSEPYQKMGISSPRAEFYGMITNLDENMARLDKTLEKLGLAENTILIFTTDNGTAAGAQQGGFNAGMRGTKGSEYDGAHRVPCFIRFPAGGFATNRDVPNLTAHIDLLPTICELCRVAVPEKIQLDGMSLKPLLVGETAESWPSRTLTVHSQRVEFPRKWRKASVMTDRWRFVCNGDKRELFDMTVDPGQKQNVAAKHPDLVKQLSASYEAWYARVSERASDYVRVTIGHPQAEQTHLTCHDWHTDNKSVPWHQNHIRSGMKANGDWAVHVAREGVYRFTLRLRPADHDSPPLDVSTATVTCIQQDGSTKSQSTTVDKSAKTAVVTMELAKGPCFLRTYLGPQTGRGQGAYFVDVELLKVKSTVKN